mgnify:CR=1 FL=1
MILLNSTSAKLQLITSTAASVKVHVSWVDNNAGVITPGSLNTSISTASTTDICPAPAASTSRAIKYIAINNVDASLSDLLTVQHTDGTTPIPIYDKTCAFGESLEFTDTGWTAFNAAGIPITSGGTGASDVQVFSGVGGTWTKPTTFNPKIVIVEMIGGGGGGGAGASFGHSDCRQRWRWRWRWCLGSRCIRCGRPSVHSSGHDWRWWCYKRQRK